MLSSSILSNEINRCLVSVYPYILLSRVLNRFSLQDGLLELCGSPSTQMIQLVEFLEIAENQSPVSAIRKIRESLSNRYTSDFEGGLMLDLIAHSSCDDFVSYDGVSILDGIAKRVGGAFGLNSSPLLLHDLILTERELTAPQFGLGHLRHRNRQTRQECLFELATSKVEIAEWLRDCLVVELGERFKDDSETETIRTWAMRARENLIKGKSE